MKKALGNCLRQKEWLCKGPVVGRNLAVVTKKKCQHIFINLKSMMLGYP